MARLTLALLLAASTAHAETDQPTREPSTAILLSVGSTLVPVALGLALADRMSENVGHSLVAAGWMIGPSVGHWYSGNRLTLGLGMRTLGIAIIGVGYLVARNTPDDGELIDSNGLGIAIGGGALMLLGAVIDLGTAGESARTFNERRIAPTVAMIRTATGTHVGPGLALTF